MVDAMADDILDLAHQVPRDSLGPALVYFAHPVSAPTPELVRANVERALRWLRWLHVRYPGVTFECSWIGHVLAMQDEASNRARGMRDNMVQVGTCTAIALCGGQRTSGMRDEERGIVARGGWTHDFTQLGLEPPPLGALVSTEVIGLLTRYFIDGSVA